MSPPPLSPRLAEVVDALPLRPGLRVLEIGGAPGTAARAVAARIGEGHVLVVDRSARGVALTERAAADEIAAGVVSVRRADAETFQLQPGEAPFDLAFALRVGALDGRHPEAGDRARRRIAAALVPTGQLLIDGGDPLREVALPRCGGRLGERCRGRGGGRVEVGDLAGECVGRVGAWTEHADGAGSPDLTEPVYPRA